MAVKTVNDPRAKPSVKNGFIVSTPDNLILYWSRVKKIQIVAFFFSKISFYFDANTPKRGE